MAEDGRDPPPEVSAGLAYLSAIRTAVRDNASAYGFSGAVTGSYGVTSAVHDHVTVEATLLFVTGVAVAFIILELLVSHAFHRPIEGEPGRVVAVANAVNLLSMASAVGCAYGGAQVGGLPGWLAAGGASTVAYLLVGGVDVLVGRLVVQQSGNPPA